MISTKDLSGLPNAERLKNFCKGLAALDIIMVVDEFVHAITRMQETMPGIKGVKNNGKRK